MNGIAVFLGCGLGGLARYAISNWLAERIAAAIPSGTLAVNVLGSLAIGFLFGWFQDLKAPPAVWLFLATGFLGGFTTFSTFALETVRLLEKGKLAAGLINLLLHNGLSLFAVVVGMGAYWFVRFVANGRTQS